MDTCFIYDCIPTVKLRSVSVKGLYEKQLEQLSTVLESSLPDSMMRRHSGMISVVRRKLITSCSSVLTKAPAVNTRNKKESLLTIMKTQSCGKNHQSRSKTPKQG